MILKGTQFDLQVTFPWEQKIFIRVELLLNGEIVETWEKSIDPSTYKEYALWITIAKKYLQKFM